MFSSPRRVIFTGFIMVVLGWVIPFLMVMQTFESTFFLNFLAYGLQIGGLVLGVAGAAGIFREQRDKDRDDYR